MSADQKQIMLTALLSMKTVGVDKRFGICTNLEHRTMNIEGVDDLEILTIMRRLFIKWPEYSGDEYFPVSHDDWEEPGDAYIRGKQLWMGEYGEARQRLLNFMIEQLQAPQ